MRFRFTSTSSDLLDAYDAFLQHRTGMRPFFRYCAVGFGVMWLSGFAFVFVAGLGSERWWTPAIWLVLGVVVTWKFGVRPILERRSVARSSPATQELDVEFTDSGARIAAPGFGEFFRPWTEFAGLYLHKRGLLFYMSDGMKHWLPKRVFAEKDQMRELATSVSKQIIPDEEE